MSAEDELFALISGWVGATSTGELPKNTADFIPDGMKVALLAAFHGSSGVMLELIETAARDLGLEVDSDGHVISLPLQERKVAGELPDLDIAARFIEPTWLEKLPDHGLSLKNLRRGGGKVDSHKTQE